MAKPKEKSRKPRVRKAPTLREQAEIAQAKSDKPKPRRISKFFRILKKPFSKLRIPRNRITRAIARVVRWVGRMLRKLVPSYFVESWREVKLVTWPGRRETWRLSLTVFIFALVFGALVTGVDKILDTIFKNVILK